MSADNDASVPTVGHGLLNDAAAYLYGVFADLSEATLDPWHCADLANFAAGYAAGQVDGRPLGAASGGDPGFWDRLGMDEGGLPVHLPMGVNAHGQGPEDDSAAFTFVCWCTDVECPLTLALGHAWAAGKRHSSS